MYLSSRQHAVGGCFTPPRPTSPHAILGTVRSHRLQCLRVRESQWQDIREREREDKRDVRRGHTDSSGPSAQEIDTLNNNQRPRHAKRAPRFRPVLFCFVLFCSVGHFVLLPFAFCLLLFALLCLALPLPCHPCPTLF